MIPTKLTLHNWCQHKELELVLVPGMNMIRGPNGCGKSNLIDALCMAASCESNNILRKSDKKTDNIMVGEDKGSIYWEFEHEGLPGAVHIKLNRNYRTDADVLAREMEYAKMQVVANGDGQDSELSDEILRLVNFRPRETVSVQLEWGPKDDENRLKLKKQGLVLEWISRVIGLQPSAIRSTFFPAQGNIDSLISGDPEARYRSLAEQAGIVLCQKIYRELGDEISVQPSFDGVEKRLKELEAELAAADRRLATAEKARDEVTAKCVDPEPLRQTITAYQQANTLRKRQAENLAKKSELEAQLAPLKTEIDQMKEEGQAQAEVFKHAESTVADAQQTLTTFENQQSAIRRYQQAKEALDAVQQQLLALPGEPKTAEDFSRLKVLDESLGAINHQISQKDGWLEKFKSGTCPTCKRPLDNAEEAVNDCRAELGQLRERQASHTSELLRLRSAKDEYDREREAWAKADAELRGRIDTHQKQLSEMPTENADDLVSEDEQKAATEAVAYYQRLRAEIDQARDAYRIKAKEYNKVLTDLEVVTKLLEEAKKDIEGSPTEEQFKAASDQYAQYQLFDQQVRDTMRELAEAKGAQETKAKDVEHERRRFERMRPTREWLGLLGQVRDLFHRNGPPRDAVLWYANRLVEQTNSYLREFDEGFSMTMGDDMSFLAVFEDGKIQPAGRLSGGEKNMLNLSIRFAYADLYPSAFRFLELDEVEVHLDQENVARLPYIFEKVKGLARNRGLVVVFISHHPALAEIADHVIDL